MAETSFSKVGPHTPLARAATNRVGGWSDASNDRVDATTHFALSVLPDAAPQPESQPPPAPTEQKLRGVLEQANAAKTCADAQLQRAQASHQRAVQYVERCRATLETFNTLDDDATNAVIAQLQGESGRLDMDGELRRRQAERGAAQDAYAAAGRAERVLGEALAAARTDVNAASKAAGVAAAAVSLVEAGRMAERALELEAEAQQLREAVLAADVPGVEPPEAMQIIQGDGKRYLRPIDRTAWEALRDQLLADPQAALEIELPARRPVPQLLHRIGHQIIHVTPIRPLTEPAPEGLVTENPEPTEANLS